MKIHLKNNIYLTLALNIVLNYNQFSFGQSQGSIIPDQTLGNNNSIVTNNQQINGVNSSLISGGKQTRATLFHSFDIFEIPVNQSAYFNNPSGVQRIITRITGAKASFIDGVLGVQGNADLFIINPRGIIFGRNSKLDLNGSFTATTADGIDFENYTFYALKPNDIPILSIDIPKGLFFKESTGSIVINNTGALLLQPTSTQSPPVLLGNLQNGLSVKPGKSLSFLASSIIFNGGILNLNSTQLNIGAIKNGYVVLGQNSQVNFEKTLAKIIDFGDINLAENSFISNNILTGGSIEIFGNNINLMEGSTIGVLSFGNQHSSINIYAKNDLVIEGLADKPIPSGFNRYATGIITANFGSANGANIFARATNIKLGKSGVISGITYQSGNGGNISLSAINIEIANTTSLTSSALDSGSSVSTGTLNNGNAGTINIDSDSLRLTNGGQVTTTSLGTGNAGNIDIKSNDIFALGVNPLNLIPSSIISTTISNGSTGMLSLSSNNLYLLDGGSVGTVTFGAGNAQTVNIFSKNILVSGVSPVSISSNSKIYSFATNIDNISALPVFSGTNFTLNGNSGNINIISQTMNLSDGGEITTRNFGTGIGGSIEIKANLVFMEKGSINAGTNNGNGGDLRIVTQAILLKESTVSTTAKGPGNGGNIDISSGVFAGDRNSSVLAQAISGRGGNINIDAGGIVGSPFISASSELGVDGTVQIRGDELKRQNNFKILPKPTISNFSPKCVPGFEGGQLIGVTQDYLNDEVLDNLATRPEQLKFVDDTDDGKIKPLIRERGYVKRNDGRLEFIYVIPADAVISSRQNLSACTLLEESATSHQDVVEQSK